MKCGDTSSGPALINRNIGRGKHEFKNKPEKKVGAQRVEGRSLERERRKFCQIIFLLRILGPATGTYTTYL